MKNLGIEGMDAMEEYDDPELRELARMEAAGEDGIDMDEDNMMAELDGMAGTKPKSIPYQEYQDLVEKEASEKVLALKARDAKDMTNAKVHMGCMKEAQAAHSALKAKYPGIENGNPNAG